MWLSMSEKPRFLLKIPIPSPRIFILIFFGGGGRGVCMQFFLQSFIFSAACVMSKFLSGNLYMYVFVTLTDAKVLRKNKSWS